MVTSYCQGKEERESSCVCVGERKKCEWWEEGRGEGEKDCGMIVTLIFLNPILSFLRDDERRPH